MKTFISILSLIAFTFSTATAFSNARDSDGTRIQARSIAMGSPVNDKLNPPGDKVDWYYFRIKETRKVQINLTTSGSTQVALSDTVGKSIFSELSNKKKLSSSRDLKPGIYYLSVSAKSGVSYSLTIK